MTYICRHPDGNHCHVFKWTKDSDFKGKINKWWHALLLLCCSVRWRLDLTDSATSQRLPRCILKITPLLRERSGRSSAHHTDSELKTQCNRRLQKHQGLISGLTIHGSRDNKVISLLIICFIRFQVSHFFFYISHFVSLCSHNRKDVNLHTVMIFLNSTCQHSTSK